MVFTVLENSTTTTFDNSTLGSNHQNQHLSSTKESSNTTDVPMQNHFVPKDVSGYHSTKTSPTIEMNQWNISQALINKAPTIAPGIDRENIQNTPWDKFKQRLNTTGMRVTTETPLDSSYLYQQSKQWNINYNLPMNPTISNKNDNRELNDISTGNPAYDQTNITTNEDNSSNDKEWSNSPNVLDNANVDNNDKPTERNKNNTDNPATEYNIKHSGLNNSHNVIETPHNSGKKSILESSWYKEQEVRQSLKEKITWIIGGSVGSLVMCCVPGVICMLMCKKNTKRWVFVC